MFNKKEKKGNEEDKNMTAKEAKEYIKTLIEEGIKEIKDAVAPKKEEEKASKPLSQEDAIKQLHAAKEVLKAHNIKCCLLYTSPSPRDS